MAQIDKLRNGIIDKLLTITNKDFLAALDALIENSSIEKGEVKLTEEQKIMLSISDSDIKNGRLISQIQLDKDDLKWLSEL